MGDNDGNISLWSIGDKIVEKPLGLIKSHKNGGELIEVYIQLN